MVKLGKQADSDNVPIPISHPVFSSMQSQGTVSQTCISVLCINQSAVTMYKTNYVDGLSYQTRVHVHETYPIDFDVESFKNTSLQARDADLPASPAGLLGRFAPSGFALPARISLASLARVSRFALTKIFEKKKCVSIDSKCSETRKNAKKIFYPFDRLRVERRSAKSERRSATLPTPKVASLPRASRFALAFSVAWLPRNLKKKSVSQSTQNGLKRIKMQKKILPL